MAATLATTTADRFAEDLEIFASPAFGYVELSANLTRASVLLPQKRNPYALAVIRAGANHLIGAATGILVSGRTPSARTDNWLHLYGDLAGTIDRARDLIALSTQVVTGLTVHVDVLASTAEEHFTGAADLAEELVLEEAIDYRTAYRAVGRAVADALADGQPQLSLASVQASVAATAGIQIDWDEAKFQSVVDPRAIVVSRTAKGGSGPQAVRDHCSSVSERLSRSDGWREQLRARAGAAESNLLQRARLGAARAGT